MRDVSRTNQALLLALGAVLLPALAAAPARSATFELIPTPDPGAASNALVDVASVGDGTAWAVGSKTGGTTAGMFLYHDGTQWGEYPLPAEVDGVAFGAAGNTPEGDVWIVGTRSFTVYEVEVFYLRARGGEIDRIDAFPVGGGPVDISASAADDVWGVSGGLWPVDAGGYVQRFDGSGWETTQLPATFIYRNRPQGIYAAAPDDVWIAGYGGDSRAEYMGYVQHWDGSSWETVPTPLDGQNLTYFLAIDGSSSSDIWIAGHVNHADDVLLHWDGSSWTRHDGPAPGDALADVVVPGTAEAWSTPYSLAPGSPFLRWDGAGWTPGAELPVPGAVTVNWRGISRGGPGDVWAVGSYHDGTTHHTLAARLVDDGPGSGVADAGDTAPAAVVLRGNHPNPFNPATAIAFELASRRTVDLRVYSSRGVLIRTIGLGSREPGAHRVVWDGRDAAGRAVAAGVYFYRLRAGEDVRSGRMALVK